MTNEILSVNTISNIEKYLINFCGVKLDSHKWFKIAPFHVALNLVSHSDLPSDSDENPAGPTKIKCWTCSGCCNIERPHKKQASSNTSFHHMERRLPWEHILQQHIHQKNVQVKWNYWDFLLYAILRKNRWTMPPFLQYAIGD